MRQVLHPDFFEFGRSGRVYDLAATLEAERSPFETVLPLPDFAVVEPAPAVALVTYVSRVRHGDGEELAANRSSLWVRDDGTWRLRFHQGTPV
jgi:ribonuclease HI